MAQPSQAAQPAPLPEWHVAREPVPYEAALADMEARASAILAHEAPERVWLLEHPPLYTGGTSAKEADLFNPQGFPVYYPGRGGQFTYHGPGQRVGYVQLDLRRRGQDLRRYVWQLEEWIIRALQKLGVDGGRREGRVGIWIARPDGSGVDDKIAALGVRVKRWITLHGVAINVAPDMTHYAGIIPCGIREHGVTSLLRLGVVKDAQSGMAALDDALRAAWVDVFEK